MPFLVPVMLLYHALGFLEIMEVDFYQRLIGVVAIGSGIYVIALRNKALLRNTILVVHYFFLGSITSICFWWVIVRPDEHSAFGLFLIMFLTGLIILRPRLTLIYFCIVIVAVLILGPVTDSPVLNLRYVFYLIFSAILIIIMAYWRQQLSRRNEVTAESYQNIFSDLAEQIFVLDENLTILAANKTALDRIKEQSEMAVIGANFREVFCSPDEEDNRRFQESVNEAKQGKRVIFEARCAVTGSNRFKQKEFKIRLSRFFEKDALILTIRSTQEQKEFENRLVESKENISRVLDNISSFVFNITFRSQGDHQVNYVSNKVKDVYGIEADEYITMVKSGRLNELFYHEDRKEAVQLFEEVLSTGASNQIKFRIVRNGEIRWLEEKIFPHTSGVSGDIQLFGIVTDITDQIESLETIADSEKRYRLIFERNLAGVYKTHVNGTILDANMSFAKILGYESIEELKKQNIRDLYYDRDDRRDYLEKLRRDGHINNHISIMRRKDGKRVILNNNVSVQPDEDGILNIIEGTLIDITEIEETATALRESEEKYRLLFEESKEGIFLLSLKDNLNTIVDLNAGAASLLEGEKSKIVGNQLINYLADATRTMEQLDTSRPDFEKEWVFKSIKGREFVAEVSLASVRLGSEHMVQLVFKDISERKRNEQTLRESQQSFKNITDNSPAAIFIFTNDELVYTNPLGEQIYKERLNAESKNLQEIFPDSVKYILQDLLRENDEVLNAFTEISLSSKDDTKQYSLNAVKTTYNNQKSDLIMLQDVTLQTEYNLQKLRAEVAEETNIKLQDEIERHRQTQAQLLEKTFWLNALFESSYNLFILSLDEKYCISSFNENFRRMIRKTLDRDVQVGDNFLDIFQPEPLARKKIEDRFERVLKGETLELISHYKAKEGEVWVESFLNPVKIGDRSVSEISFISHEITEKIEAQQKIKISEANNRAILLALPDIITKVNKEGVFVDFRMSQVNGLDPLLPHLKTGVFLGNHIHDVVKDEAIVAKFLEIVQHVLATNEFATHTFELKQSEGRPLYYENRFSKMNENEVIVLARNVTETIEYEAMLVESVKEKEVLLKEVHHRVKNNLQVINSILNLQSSYVEDPKTLEIINESQNRIRSMSYIHESLYQTKDFSSIHFGDYITNLVQNLVHSYQLYQDKIDLVMDIGSVRLGLDQAIPCGLILNELVSNALKYAYPGKKKGKIVIHVSERDDKISLGVQDYGVGLPEDFKIENSESLGLSLVYTLADQLDGQLNLDRNGGTKFLITFDKQEV